MNIIGRLGIFIRYFSFSGQDLKFKVAKTLLNIGLSFTIHDSILENFDGTIIAWACAWPRRWGRPEYKSSGVKWFMDNELRFSFRITRIVEKVVEREM